MQFFQWNEPLTFPPLDRHRATLLVGQKIFHRREQKRAKSPLFFADGTETPALQYLRKKSLGNILRLCRSNALSPEEAVDRSPVHAAKFLERFVCSWRFSLRLKHHAPMR